MLILRLNLLLKFQNVFTNNLYSMVKWQLAKTCTKTVSRPHLLTTYFVLYITKYRRKLVICKSIQSCVRCPSPALLKILHQRSFALKSFYLNFSYFCFLTRRLLQMKISLTPKLWQQSRTKSRIPGSIITKTGSSTEYHDVLSVISKGADRFVYKF